MSDIHPLFCCVQWPAGELQLPYGHGRWPAREAPPHAALCEWRNGSGFACPPSSHPSSTTTTRHSFTRPDGRPQSSSRRERARSCHVPGTAMCSAPWEITVKPESLWTRAAAAGPPLRAAGIGPPCTEWYDSRRSESQR
jgi:hypothetical protein